MEYLQCESKDGGVFDLLEVEEESNLPLEGSARAWLGKEKPQKVLDPINCLPIHLHCTILEGALQLFKMPLASNIDTLEGEKQESLKQSQLRAK